MDIELNATDARVLGALLEKELLTPDIYPLSLNSLVSACNQTTSRDPVTTLDEVAIMSALDSLRAKKLSVTVVQAGSRVPKYSQQLTRQINLHPPEHAILCLLLLRGPQTIGELKTRSGRLYEFADLEEVEKTLIRLEEERYPARVAKLPRQPGMKESRYAQLLCGAVAAPEVSLSLSVSASMAERVARLEEEVAALREELARFKQQFD